MIIPTFEIFPVRFPNKVVGISYATGVYWEDWPADQALKCVITILVLYKQDP